MNRIGNRDTEVERNTLKRAIEQEIIQKSTVIAMMEGNITIDARVGAAMR